MRVWPLGRTFLDILVLFSIFPVVHCASPVEMLVGLSQITIASF